MKELPLTHDMMVNDRRLNVDSCYQENGKVTVVWVSARDINVPQPTEYERMIAQSCTMYQPCVHKF